MNNNIHNSHELQAKLTEHTKDLLQDVQSMAYVERATLNYLLALSTQHERLEISQINIATKIGTTRQSVNGAVKKLHDKGYINKTYRYKLSCIYKINNLFNDSSITQALKKLLPALCIIPLFLLMPLMALRKQNNYQREYLTLNANNSFSIQRLTRESTSSQYSTHAELTNHIPEVQTDHEGTELPDGTNVEETLASYNKEYWNLVTCSSKVPTQKERYFNELLKKQDEENELLMKSIKEAMMINPIKESVMNVTPLLNLNKVGQIRLMQYPDAALKYAAIKFKESKAKKDRPFEYFMGIANNYIKKHNIEVDQPLVTFLLDTYGLSIDMKPTGVMHGIDAFKGEPAKSPETKRLATNTNAATRLQAPSEDSGKYRILQNDELVRLRDLLESYEYDPFMKKHPLPDFVMEDVKKAQALLAAAKIMIRPMALWVEQTMPKREDFPNKEMYMRRLCTWKERKALLMENKRIVAFEEYGEPKERELDAVNVPLSAINFSANSIMNKIKQHISTTTNENNQTNTNNHPPIKQLTEEESRAMFFNEVGPVTSKQAHKEYDLLSVDEIVDAHHQMFGTVDN